MLSMTIKLDLKDKKILALLDEDARFTNSQIARRVKLSKPAVEYRIQRFNKNKVISQCYTVIDFTKLGYSQYKVYFNFQDVSLEEEKRIFGHWVKDKNSVWVASVRGRWDLAVSIIAKSNFEFGQVLNGFMNKFSKFILDKDVLLTEYSPIYSREYLANAKSSEFVYGVPSEIVSLDDSDKKILKVLSVNARINIIDLAKKTKLSRDIVNYRIKKLTKQGIIFQYRCYLDLPNIGIRHYKVIFRTKNFDEKAEKQIKNYVSSHKKATQFLKLIGSWDLEIEFEVENEEELYKVINEMRLKFSNIIRDFDILRIVKTAKYNYWPF